MNEELITQLLDLYDKRESGKEELTAAKMLILLHRRDMERDAERDNNLMDNYLKKGPDELRLRREGAIEELRLMLADGPLIPGAMTQYITGRINKLKAEATGDGVFQQAIQTPPSQTKSLDIRKAEDSPAKSPSTHQKYCWNCGHRIYDNGKWVYHRGCSWSSDGVCTGSLSSKSNCSDCYCERPELGGTKGIKHSTSKLVMASIQKHKPLHLRLLDKIKGPR